MAPHFLSLITDQQGDVVQRYHPYMWRHPIGPPEAAMISSLMQRVVTEPYGTAAGVGFLPQDEVAAKTGTAQTGDAEHQHRRLDDRVRAGDEPVIAVAVVRAEPDVLDVGRDGRGADREVRDRGRARDRREAAARGDVDDVPRR